MIIAAFNLCNRDVYMDKKKQKSKHKNKILLKIVLGIEALLTALTALGCGSSDAAVESSTDNADKVVKKSSDEAGVDDSEELVIETSDEPVPVVIEEGSLPFKDGFNEVTDVIVKDYTFSVPTYWEADIEKSDIYRAYCNDDSFAMLIIATSENDNDYTFDNAEMRSSFANGMLSSFELRDYEVYTGTINDTFGLVVNFDTKQDDINMKGYTFSFIDDGYTYSIQLVVDEDNAMDYRSDVLKIIESKTK